MSTEKNTVSAVPPLNVPARMRTVAYHRQIAKVPYMPIIATPVPTPLTAFWRMPRRTLSPSAPPYACFARSSPLNAAT